MLRTKLFVYLYCFFFFLISIWGTMFYTCIGLKLKNIFPIVFISVNKEYVDENLRGYIIQC